jgi:hypothetical protein
MESRLLPQLDRAGALGPRVAEWTIVAILSKLCKTPRAGEGQVDDLGRFAVIAEEMFGPIGGEAGPRKGCLKRTEAWPIFDGVDQIRGRGVGKGVGHLLKDIVGFHQLELDVD